MAPLHIPNEFWITLSYLCFIFCAIPFSWHLEAWNSGTCLYMLWAGLANLNQAINATVWNGNAVNRAPVWCDISVRFILSLNFAIPCTSLCINRRLYLISSLRFVNFTKAEKRRAVLVDLVISIGIPIILMALEYIVQGHRFNIFGDVGCSPAIFDTPVAIVLVSMPPIIIGLVSAVYSILTIRAFSKRRQEVKKFLSEAGGSINPHRYLRLMALAGIEACLTVPFAIWFLCEKSVILKVYPWKSWADTHDDFSRVDLVPASIWRANSVTVRSIELNRLATCLCGIVFFAFFGFAEEALLHYRLGVQFLAKLLGISSFTASVTPFRSFRSKSKVKVNTTPGKDTLPVVMERPVIRESDYVGTSFPDVSANSAAITFDERRSPLVQEFSHNLLKPVDVGGTLDLPDIVSPTHLEASSSTPSTATIPVLTCPPSRNLS